MAGCQQGVNDMAADESGTAGNESFHGIPNCWNDVLSLKFHTSVIWRKRDFGLPNIALEYCCSMLHDVLGVVE